MNGRIGRLEVKAGGKQAFAHGKGDFDDAATPAADSVWPMLS